MNSDNSGNQAWTRIVLILGIFGLFVCIRRFFIKEETENNEKYQKLEEIEEDSRIPHNNHPPDNKDEHEQNTNNFQQKHNDSSESEKMDNSNDKNSANKIQRQPPPSLRNMGATCYLNSAFQGIAACDTFVKEISDLTAKDKDKSVKQLHVFKELIDILNGCSRGEMEISKNPIFCQWNKPGQQDSYEVLAYALNQVYNELRKHKETIKEIAERDLQRWLEERLPMRYILKYYIRCGCQMMTSSPLQSDLALHVTIPNNQKSCNLDELLDLFFDNDPIYDYSCDRAGCEGKDTFRIAKLCKPLPRTFCVHLQRTFWNGYRMVKIDKEVKFKTELIIKSKYYKVEDIVDSSINSSLEVENSTKDSEEQVNLEDDKVEAVINQDISKLNNLKTNNIELQKEDDNVEHEKEFDKYIEEYINHILMEVKQSMLNGGQYNSETFKSKEGFSEEIVDGDKGKEGILPIIQLDKEKSNLNNKNIVANNKIQLDGVFLSSIKVTHEFEEKNALEEQFSSVFNKELIATKEIEISQHLNNEEQWMSSVLEQNPNSFENKTQIQVVKVQDTNSIDMLSNSINRLSMKNKLIKSLEKLTMDKPQMSTDSIIGTSEEEDRNRGNINIVEIDNRDVEVKRSGINEINKEDEDETYDLVSVIQHSGSVNGGHYICYRKVDNKWFLTNDSCVREVAEETVLRCQAYILFYEQSYDNK